MFLTKSRSLGKQGQHSAEYVVMIVLVMAAIIIMGNYIIRSWNAQAKGWGDSVADSFQEPVTPN